MQPALSKYLSSPGGFKAPESLAVEAKQTIKGDTHSTAIIVR